MIKRQQWLVLFLLFPLSLMAGDKPVARLKAFLAASKSLTAEFKQISIDEKGNPAQTRYGMFYLQRPGKFRWDYQKPFAQQIVSQKGKVWFYDAGLEQVTIKKIDQSLGATPALLLSGEVDLEENFTLQQQGMDAGLQWVRLQPKSEQSSFKYVLIGLEKGLLSGMELSDNFGFVTRIYFSNVRVNEKIAPDIFEFVPPAGVDVFEEK